MSSNVLSNKYGTAKTEATGGLSKTENLINSTIVEIEFEKGTSSLRSFWRYKPRSEGDQMIFEDFKISQDYKDDNEQKWSFSPLCLLIFKQKEGQ